MTSPETFRLVAFAEPTQPQPSTLRVQPLPMAWWVPHHHPIDALDRRPELAAALAEAKRRKRRAGREAELDVSTVRKLADGTVRQPLYESGRALVHLRDRLNGWRPAEGRLPAAWPDLTPSFGRLAPTFLSKPRAGR
jgi:hypothetical protein